VLKEPGFYSLGSLTPLAQSLFEAQGALGVSKCLPCVRYGAQHPCASVLAMPILSAVLMERVAAETIGCFSAQFKATTKFYQANAAPLAPLLPTRLSSKP
jgi:hypothetical protein